MSNVKKTRASRPKRLPVVLSMAEVRAVLAHLDGTCWLIANLLYGSGLRLMEAHRLRVKDLVMDRGELIVRDAKGGRDRVTMLPAAIVGSQISQRRHAVGMAVAVSRQLAVPGCIHRCLHSPASAREDRSACGPSRCSKGADPAAGELPPWFTRM